MRRAPVYALLLYVVTGESSSEVDQFLNPCQDGYTYHRTIDEFDWDLFRYGNLARMERSLDDLGG